MEDGIPAEKAELIPSSLASQMLFFTAVWMGFSVVLRERDYLFEAKMLQENKSSLINSCENKELNSTLQSYMDTLKLVR